MSTIFAERPRFFEGQYLGADDLDSFLQYARQHDARHLLGGHAWGIVSGIELVDATSATGEPEYFLTPGVAVDGFGRLLVLTAPFKLTTDLFAQQPGGSVTVWIRHDETAYNSTRAGFQTCDCSESYTRVAESVAIEVGPRPAVSQRQSPLALGDELFTDARDAPGWSLPGQPLACDSSVPAQLFPAEGDPDLWLIPVGQLAWNRATNAFLAPTEADRKASRRVRRQAGTITESIYPAAGLLRLRPRFTPRKAGVSADQTCAEDAVTEADLTFCDDRLTFREMIWLEGDVRFRRDARLRGALEFQEAQGTDYLDNGVPLVLRRAPEPNEHHGHDLQLMLGVRTDGSSPTRLTIGRARASGDDLCSMTWAFEPGVYVQEDARVGIGTTNSLLALPLTVRAVGDNGDLLGFQATDGDLAWQINFGPPDVDGLNFTENDPATTRLFLETGGQIGIGTLTPEAKLDIRNVPAASGGAALGNGKWLQVGDGDDKGRMWLQYGDQGAPLMVLSDLDDPPRLQFQQAGNGNEAGPQFASWIGHARSNSGDLAVMGGALGINTLQPFRRLHVEASEIHSGGAGAGFSFGNREDAAVEAPANGERWVWYASGRTARLWSGSDKLHVTAAGNLGLGTAAPLGRLDVRGDIRLGSNGEFYGIGCADNVRMVAGRVSAAGSRLSGSGFTVSRVSAGRYQISYDTAFSTVPTVVASLVESPAEDNFLTILSSGGTGFQLQSRDDNSGAAASEQDSAFNFIALGLRP